MKKVKTDILVIGGGAAGLFAAGTAAASGAHVTLAERNPQVGAKLRITGKGRCNVTSDCLPEEALRNVLRGAKFLRGAMFRCPPRDMMEFFKSMGVPLKTERGNRVFPVSDRAQDIVDALREFCRKGGVEIRQAEVTDLQAQDGAVTGVRTRAGSLQADRVIFCTGGCSYPATGSDGTGLEILRRAGHSIIPPRPSLVPLTAEGEDCRDMTGLTLRNAGLRLLDQQGKEIYSDFGELLFTFFGLSGPTVLSASCHVQPGQHYTLELDLKPALDEKTLDARLLRDLEKYRNRTLDRSFDDLLPAKMIPVFVRRSGIAPDRQANSVTKEERRRLLRLLKHFSFEITGTRPIAEAIITAGGVDLREVDPRTMASRKLKGLYLAGEVLDCDAYTGGFNLQIAWATAKAAAAAAAAG